MITEMARSTRKRTGRAPRALFFLSADTAANCGDFQFARSVLQRYLHDELGYDKDGEPTSLASLPLHFAFLKLALASHDVRILINF